MTLPLAISVFGAAAAGPEVLALAERVGRQIARAGAVLVCG
ncbi:MAG: TIGR00725 family protein, partial [Planctomycetes bacterium]|nr:TIGR00725 family protein [Planctomycetota bacterium]